MSDRKGKIIDLFSEAKKRGKSISQKIVGSENTQITGNVIDGKEARKQRPSLENGISQTIKGNGNVQVTGNFVTTKRQIIKVLPSECSIGSAPLLKETIMARFNKLGEEREKRFGKNAYPAMYRKFKSDFSIKNNSWTIIWTWPKDCAPEILNYLDDKFNETIQGRIERAARREGYLHKRPHLYKMEEDLLKHLGYSMNSPEVKGFLLDHFGVSSHSELTHLQHWVWVNYLQGRVKQLEDQ